MIRAVIDTNVCVAALISREGTPARIVKAVADGLVDPVVCPRLIAELTGVLARPKIARHIPADIAHDYVVWLERIAVAVPDPQHVPALTPDPDDDYILALAETARAQVIVSGDAHLLELVGAGVRVLSPAAFADFVEGLR